jgi:nitrite reductase/ring-hydroxylating ferredoxin subunit
VTLIRPIERSDIPEGAQFAHEIEMTEADAAVPVARYTSQAFHQEEMERLWPNCWQMVCRERDIATGGDYQEYTIGRRSYLVVRGDDGLIRGFHNACAHRGMQIKSGCGNTGSQLTCIFHMWSYHLDGSLKSISDRETFCPLKDEDYGLTPILADTWGGWVFIHPNPPTAQPLAEFLAPLAGIAEAYQARHLVPIGMNVATTVSANWKVVVEGFLEEYHIHAIHPQALPSHDDYNVSFKHLGPHSMMAIRMCTPSPRLGPEETIDPIEILEVMFSLGDRSAAADPDDPRAHSSGGLGDYRNTTIVATDPLAPFAPYRDEAGDIELPPGLTVREILKGYYRDLAAAKGVDLSGLTDEQLVSVWQFHIFPNVVINFGPGKVTIHRVLPHPHDPNQSRWEFATLEWVPDDGRARELKTPQTFFPENSQSLGLVLDQDVDQMPRCQRGLHSMARPYVVLSKQENRIAHFQKVLGQHVNP